MFKSSFYKINNDRFVKKGNNGGPTAFDDVKKAKIIKLLNEKNIILSNLVLFFENYTSINNTLIFFLEYEKIPPKTSRLIFRTLTSIEDIPQRGIKTFYDNDLKTRIFYELQNDEAKRFCQNIKKLIDSLNNGHDFEDWSFANKVSKIISFGTQGDVSQIFVKTPVRLLPIKWILDSLKQKNILTNTNFVEETSIAFLTPQEFEIIFNEFPQIIVETFGDLSVMTETFNYDNYVDEIKLGSASNKAVVGVIDSGLQLPREFSKFIESIEDKRLHKVASDKNHGSWVTSLIIANDELNPTQVDGLGNFAVKHFEVLEPRVDGKIGADFMHLRNVIKNAIQDNQHIKIWNLSFGGLKIPFTILMSPLGVFLDQISNEFDVLFCIAAGNDRNRITPYWTSINQPADSLNCLAVGSVKTSKNGNIIFSEYSSFGPILHFEKPDVSDWGGPNNQDNSPLVAFGSSGKNFGISGTSFSTPRISRLAAYLVSKGMSPREAKAKIISMATRETPSNKSSAFGYVNKNPKTLDLNTTIALSDNKPVYLPINLIAGVEKVTITVAHFVKPHSHLGEEYGIHDVTGKLIWHDPEYDNPEYALNGGAHAKTVKTNLKSDDEFHEEYVKRFEGGKYFNSKKEIFSIKNILDAKEKENYELALRLRKQDLFEMTNSQTIDVSVVISFEGNFDERDFLQTNESIVLIDIEQDVEV